MNKACSTCSKSACSQMNPDGPAQGYGMSPGGFAVMYGHLEHDFILQSIAIRWLLFCKNLPVSMQGNAQPA